LACILRIANLGAGRSKETAVFRPVHVRFAQSKKARAQVQRKSIRPCVSATRTAQSRHKEQARMPRRSNPEAAIRFA